MESIGMPLPPQLSQVNQAAPPAPPDQADVQEFQNIYWQDSNQVRGPHGGEAILIVPSDMEVSPGNFFTKAMEKMAEANEKGVMMRETLVERVSHGGVMGGAEMLDVQMQIHDATATLGIYQSFDKKSEEGIKMLMTGQ